MWPPETGAAHPEKHTAVTSKGNRKTGSAAGQSEARGQSRPAELCPRVWGLPLPFSLACYTLGRSKVQPTPSVLNLTSEQQLRWQVFPMSHPRTHCFRLWKCALGRPGTALCSWRRCVHARVDGGHHQVPRAVAGAPLCGAVCGKGEQHLTLPVPAFLSVDGLCRGRPHDVIKSRSSLD